MDELYIFFKIPVDGWEDCIIEPYKLHVIVMDNILEVISLALGFLILVFEVVSNLLSCASDNCSIPIKLVLLGSFMIVT